MKEAEGFPKYLTGAARQLALARTLAYEGYRRLPVKTLLRMNRLLASEKLVAHGGRYVINSFLPPFPSRAFASLAQGVARLAAGEPSPVSAYFAVTDACRYSCPHCSKAGRNGEPMASGDWRRVIRETQELGVSIIGFTGGEPLLMRDIEELVASVDDRSATLLFTSGDGLDPARARSLADAGLFGAAVSLDSFDEAEHDRGRGTPGAFRSAVEAIGSLKEAGIYAMAQIVATRERCDREWMRRYLAFARSLGVDEVRLLEPMPCGRILGSHGQWRISREQHDWLRRIHADSNADRQAVKVSSFAFVEDVSRYGCGAGFQHFYVDCLGNVQPCDFTPVSFGNIRREPLSAALARLQKAFARPRARCFMLENGERIAACSCAETPKPAAALGDTIDFGDTGPLPAFYRALGWKDSAEDGSVREGKGAAL